MVLNALRLTLLAAPALKARLKHQAERELKARKTGSDDMTKLRTQLDDVTAQVAFVIRNVKLVGEDASAAQLVELARRRDDLQRELRLAEMSGQTPVEDVDAVVERVVEELRKTGEEYGDLLGEEDGSMYTHQFDAQANTAALLDEFGQVAARFKYYAFGQVAAVSVEGDA
ncbi:MAG: hypothetical protein QOF78_3382, partial [Phycisphaerales bacterium]|nr:hypothetical protein [Phycisphaerales bacterium]